MKLRGSALAAMGLVSMMSAQSAYAVDACSLLTPGEAATALGVPEVKAGGNATRCNWTPAKYARGAGQLMVVIEGAKDGAKMLNLGSAVSGVGDEAIQTVAGNDAVLHVRKGATWFVVSDHGVPLDQGKQVEQTVAKQMAGRM